MRWLNRILHRRRLDRDLDRELRFHVEEETRRLEAVGLDPAEARRRALAAFGGLEPMKDLTREARGTAWIEDLGKDLRFAGRMMSRSPGFAATAVLSLAIGIGANAAIFSVTDALVRRPLPIDRPDELFFLKMAGDTGENLRFYRFSGPQFDALRAQVPEVTFVAMTPASSLQATIDERARLLLGQLVSGNWFRALGVGSSVGRVLTADDTRALGGEMVVVLSHACWDREFGRDPHVVGAPLVVNGQRLTVVGVAAEGFTGVSVGTTVDLWLPVTLQQTLRYHGSASISDADATKAWLPQDGISWLTIAARIPGARLATAGAHIAATVHASLEAIASHEADAAARADILRHYVELEPGARGQSSLRGTFSTSLSVLSVTVALVLLIACANLASLLLARSTARSREFALRLSIGARRGRLVRQMLTESLLLAMVGGGLGVMVAQWGAHALLRLASSTASPIPLAIAVDWRLLGFSFGVSLVTGVLFGLGPALRLSRTDVHDALRPGARVVGAQGKGVLTVGRGLVVGQVALSLALLIGAMLFVRTLGNLLSSDLGFDRDAVIGARFDEVLAGVPPAAWPDLNRRIVDAARAIPGVKSASLALNGPLAGGGRISAIQIEGQAQRPGSGSQVREEYVGPDYFATVGMVRMAGRDLTSLDDTQHPCVAVVNQALAVSFFGRENPIGKRFGYDGKATTEIVGIVRDARVDGAQKPVPPMVYYPLSQFPAESIRHLYVRVQGAAGLAEAVPAGIRTAIANADPRIAVADVATLEQLSERTVTVNRIVSQLTSVFGLLAVAVACLGLYGTLSYAVSQRTREIGVRLALGSAPWAVCWIVFRDALVLVAAGCAVGLGLAWLGLTSVAQLLYGLSPRDPATFATATAAFLVVACTAAAVPAFRAARVDPLSALRVE
jgi:predicted permease